MRQYTLILCGYCNGRPMAVSGQYATWKEAAAACVQRNKDEGRRSWPSWMWGDKAEVPAIAS